MPAERRGSVHWVYFDPVVGSEQAGRRPAVIVSSDDLSGAPTVIVVPLSSRVPETIPSYLVHLASARTGLPRDSVAMCHQVRCVSVRRLVGDTRLRLPDADMRAIDRALLYTLGLEDVAA